MSKDTPEVGDIWECNGQKIVIVNILAYTDENISPDYQILYNIKHWFDLGHIRKEDFDFFTYLGKSKANINELFEVEDESRTDL